MDLSLAGELFESGSNLTATLGRQAPPGDTGTLCGQRRESLLDRLRQELVDFVELFEKRLDFGGTADPTLTRRRFALRLLADIESEALAGRQIRKPVGQPGGIVHKSTQSHAGQSRGADEPGFAKEP